MSEKTKTIERIEREGKESGLHRHKLHKRNLQMVLSALLLACLVAAPCLVAQDAPAGVRKGFFWKATSGGNTVYLLGSIHLGTKDMYPLPKEIEDAFAVSSTLIVEADINKVDKEKMQAMMLSKGTYAGDDSLWDHVSPETRKLVEQFCEKYHLPVSGFAKMRPWVVAIAVAVIPMVKAGGDPNLGIDKYFLDKAGQGGEKKTVVEIESAEWQVNLLSGFSEGVQGKFLASALEQSGNSPENFKKLVDLWMSGDASGVDAIIGDGSDLPEIRKPMLQDRNPHMADVAEQYLKKNVQAFLVVGAAHMVGEDGVVALLEKRGYKIQQVALAKQPLQEVHLIPASKGSGEIANPLVGKWRATAGEHQDREYTPTERVEPDGRHSSVQYRITATAFVSEDGQYQYGCLVDDLWWRRLLMVCTDNSGNKVTFTRKPGGTASSKDPNPLLGNWSDGKSDGEFTHAEWIQNGRHHTVKYWFLVSVTEGGRGYQCEFEASDFDHVYCDGFRLDRAKN
jgi:uncharacterized protein YbaP (TraB family)